LPPWMLCGRRAACDALPSRTGCVPGPSEVYLEFVVYGSTAKVTAIDPATGCEASVVAPASSPRAVLEQAALRKLEYVLAKERGRP
jgi:hypothetical protein